MKDVLYFGCIGQPGHYLRDPRGGCLRHDATAWGNMLDTGLCPEPDIPNGVVKYHVKDGWSAVAFWDRSGDHRPGSNSAFIIAEVMLPIPLLDLARSQWPQVFERRGFPLQKHAGGPLPIIMPEDRSL